MKNIIYGLLITTSTGSAVYAEQAPQRPTTPPKVAPQRPSTAVPTNRAPLKADNSICPDELNMTQLNDLKDGKLKLAGYKFDLHTSKADFEAMLPSKMQFISQKHSIAKISEGKALKGRAIISDIRGHVLKCTYNFQTALRTALGSKTAQQHFDILSEPAGE